jgi:hypothetical protein
MAAAAALTWGRSPLAEEPRNQWRRWLAEYLWSRRRFCEAAVLSQVGWGAGSTRLPKPPFALLAAAQAVGVADAVLQELAADPALTETERLVVAGVALVEAALRGSPTAVSVVEQPAADLPAGWQAVLAAFRAYWSQAFEPLPVERIQQDLHNRSHGEAVEAKWRALATAFDKAAATHFKFESGTKTHEWLFHEESSWGRLRGAIAARSRRLVGEWREWLQREFKSDLDALLDFASAEAGEKGREIDHTKRRTYLKSLKQVREAADAVHEAMGETEDAAEMTRRILHAQAFADELGRRWPELEADWAARTGPERKILERALADLRFLVDWRRHP